MCELTGSKIHPTLADCLFLLFCCWFSVKYCWILHCFERCFFFGGGGGGGRIFWTFVSLCPDLVGLSIHFIHESMPSVLEASSK